MNKPEREAEELNLEALDAATSRSDGRNLIMFKCTKCDQVTVTMKVSQYKGQPTASKVYLKQAYRAHDKVCPGRPS